MTCALSPFRVFDVSVCGADPTGATDSHAAFQAAIDAAAASHGETVFVPPGVYVLHEGLRMVTPGQRLLLDRCEIRYVVRGGSDIMLDLQAPGVVIEGTSRDGCVLTTSLNVIGINLGTGCRVSDVTLRGPDREEAFGRSVGINSGNAEGVVIEACLIERWGRHAINTGGGCTAWTIVGNVIQDNHWGGILCSAGARGDRGTSGFYMAGNLLQRNGTNGIDCNGSKHRIIGNDVRSSGDKRSSAGFDQWGILLQALEGHDASDNIIAQNRCEDNAQHGIILRAADGQTCSRNVVMGNTCVANGADGAIRGDGIVLDGTAGGTVADNTVVGNTSWGNGRSGVGLDGFGSTAVSGNLVEANVTRENGGYGVWISHANARDNLVAHNVALGNGAGQVGLNPDAAPTRTQLIGNRTSERETAWEVGSGVLRVGSAANEVKRIDLYGYENAVGSGVYHSLYGSDRENAILAVAPIGGRVFEFHGRTGDLGIGGRLRVDGTPVVGSRQRGIADARDTSVRDTVNRILDALRAHGLIEGR